MSKSYIPKVFRENGSSNLALEIEDHSNLFSDIGMKDKVNGCDYLSLKIVQMDIKGKCADACQGPVKCVVKSNDILDSVMCLSHNGSCPKSSDCLLSKSLDIHDGIEEGSLRPKKSPLKNHPNDGASK